MPPDFEEQLQQLLHRYADPIGPTRDTFAEIKARLRVPRGVQGDEGNAVEYAFTLEDTLEETMAEGHDLRDQPPPTTARSSGWGDRKRALSPRATAIAGIAAALILAVVATTIYTQFVAPTRTPPPGKFTTGAFESIPLPAVPGANIGWVRPSPRDPATAYVCTAPQGDPYGPISLWVTHNAGQAWSRAPLPDVTGSYCDVEPAWDGSHRVAITTSTDVLDQNAQACAHSRFFLSDDDGATWRSIAHTNLAPPVSRGGDCTVLVTAKHLFLQTFADNANYSGEELAILERSDDDGRTWQRADHGLEALQLSGLPQAPWFFALPLDATGEALVTRDTTTNGGVITQGDFWITHDAGAHWQRVTVDKLPDSPFVVQSNMAMMTEPASADALRACQCVFLVYPYNFFNQRLYSSRDLAHWTPLPPLPVQGASAERSGVYATLGMTGDGRLLALGPDPDAGLPSLSDFNGLFAKVPPALWLWDTHTGRWEVARTRLPCVNPANCYALSYDLIGVSIDVGATGQPPGTWFWISAGGSGSGHYWRVFIPAA
jgi:hypothetical protein